MKSLSHIRLFATLWTVAHQAPPSMGFSRQEHWSGVATSFSRGLPDQEIEPRPPALQADALTSEPPGKPNERGKGQRKCHSCFLLASSSLQALFFPTILSPWVAQIVFLSPCIPCLSLPFLSSLHPAPAREASTVF